MTRPRPEHEGEPARTTLAPEEEAKPVEPSGAAAPRPADYPREVRQRAAVILEVLAGVRSPTEAAQVLSLSVSQYYVLEEKALAAVVAACAPQAPGRS